MWTNILAAALLTAISSGVVIASERPRPGPFIAILLSVTFLAYQGGSGLLYAIGLVPSIVFLGWRIMRGRTSGSTFTLLASVSFACAIAFGIVLIKEAQVILSGEAGMGGRSRVLVAVLNMMAHGFGQYAESHLVLCSILMPLLIVATLYYAVIDMSRRNVMAVTSALLVLPVLVLCAAVAISRTGGSGGYTSRYVGMVMPIWCPLAFTAVAVESRGVLRVLVLCASLLLATSFGMSLQSHVAMSIARLAADHRLEEGIEAGHSAERLSADLSAEYKVFPPERFTEQLCAVKSLRRGCLADISDSNEYAWRSIPAIPDVTRSCLRESDSWLLSEESLMHFSFGGEPGAAYAVRIAFDFVGSWAVFVGGGPTPQPGGAFLGLDLVSRQLYPIGKGTSGMGESYSTVFVFEQAAEGFVFRPPAGGGSIRILSLQIGEKPVLRATRIVE
jgi:hypothetical protein